MDGKYERLYILIFPCLNVQATHVGLVTDMRTQAVTQALIDFARFTEYPVTYTVAIIDLSLQHWVTKSSYLFTVMDSATHSLIVF